jgi:putative tryptophan/tyrosine transport system substrate-binding protein
MDRRRFLLTSLAGALAAPRAVGAQKPGKVPKVGFLTSASDVYALSTRVPAQLGLLGWRENHNVRFHFAAAGGTDEGLDELAKKLVAESDLIVASGTAAVRAAKGASRTIPIVSVFEEDPVQSGFIVTLGRPDTNVTGIAVFGPELAGKRVELIRELVPRLSHLAVLWSPMAPGAPAHWRSVQGAAEALGVRVLSLEVRESADFKAAFVTARRRMAGALLVLTNVSLVWAHAAIIAGLAAEAGLPALYPDRWWTLPQQGGLASYGEDHLDISMGIARYVDRVLKGAVPGSLPIERPTKFELVINLKAAKALGLTIPPSLLARADQVIE